MAAAALQRSGSGGRALLLALGVSAVAHLGMYRLLHAPNVSRPAPATPVQVEIELRAAPEVARAEPVQQQVRKVPPPPKRALRKGPTLAKSAPAPRALPAPPMPARAPPPPEVEAPPVGLDFASTVSESAFVVPVGTTLMGAPPKAAPAPAPSTGPGGTGRGGKLVPFDQVSEPPVVVSEVRAAYPEAARAAGITGEVLLLITVDADGHVTQATRLAGPGHGLDEAALGAIRGFRFRPAQAGGQPVATVIRYIYAFDIS